MDNDGNATGHVRGGGCSALLSSVSASSGGISEGDLRITGRDDSETTMMQRERDSESEGSSGFKFSEMQIGTARGRVIEVSGRGGLDSVSRTTMTTSGTGTNMQTSSRSESGGRATNTARGSTSTSVSGGLTNGGRLGDYSPARDSLGDSLGMISLPSGMSSLDGGNDDGDSWSSNFDLNALTRSVERVLREGEREGGTLASTSTSQRRSGGRGGGKEEEEEEEEEGYDDDGHQSGYRKQRTSEQDGRKGTDDEDDVLVEDDAWRGDSELADLAGRVEAMLAGGDEEDTKLNMHRVNMNVHSGGSDVGSSEVSSRSGSSAVAILRQSQQQSTRGDDNNDVLVEDDEWRGHAELADVAGQVEAMLRGSASGTATTALPLLDNANASEDSRRRRDDVFLSLSSMTDTTGGDGGSRAASDVAADVGVGQIRTEEQLSFDELETRLNDALQTLTDTSTVVQQQHEEGEEQSYDDTSRTESLSASIGHNTASTSNTSSAMRSSSSSATNTDKSMDSGRSGSRAYDNDVLVEDDEWRGHTELADVAGQVEAMLRGSTSATANTALQLDNDNTSEDSMRRRDDIFLHGKVQAQSRREAADLTVSGADDNGGGAVEARVVTELGHGTTNMNASTQESEGSWQHVHDVHADVNADMDDIFLRRNNNAVDDDDCHVSVSQSVSPSDAAVRNESTAHTISSNTSRSYGENYVDVDDRIGSSDVAREGGRSTLRIASAEDVLNAQPNSHREGLSGGTSNGRYMNTGDTRDTRRSADGDTSRIEVDSSFEQHVDIHGSTREGNHNSGDRNVNMVLSPDSAHSNNNIDGGGAYTYDDDEFEDDDDSSGTGYGPSNSFGHRRCSI